MSRIDEMTYRFAQTDAEVHRAKNLAAACINALKPDLVAALRPHVHDGVEVGQLVNPLLAVFDQINSKRGEQREREVRSSAKWPPLKVYPRKLGIRPATSGKRKVVDNICAFAYDTCLEEVLEREIEYDPSFLPHIILACKQWTRRAHELKNNRRDPQRYFADQVDGEVWQDHIVLGDPDYSGISRVAMQGYGDDVDIPNGIGPAAGHHKIYVQTVTVINRPVRGRMTMRAQCLMTVCLASDMKTFGAHRVISGSGQLEYSLGATCRRLWTRAAGCVCHPKICLLVSPTHFPSVHS